MKLKSSTTNLDIKPRQLQRRLKACTNKDQRYKQAYIQKVLSKANRKERLEYGQKHKDKSIDDFWQYIFFTDEAHIDPSSMRQGYILQEQGRRYDTENIQERPELLGVRLHVTARTTYYNRSYNCVAVVSGAWCCRAESGILEAPPLHILVA